MWALAGHVLRAHLCAGSTGWHTAHAPDPYSGLLQGRELSRVGGFGAT